MKRDVLMFVVLASLATNAKAHAESSDPWFGRDKYLHGGVSAALTLGGYATASVFVETRTSRLLAGTGLALAAGVGKELVDLGGPGDASWRDMSFNVLGIVSGAFVAWMVDTYLL